jgi:multidrug efflux pump subunit AcrA (membrane-fusion protein)
MRGVSAVAAGALGILAVAAWGQHASKPEPSAAGTPATARVETAPLELALPDRYNVPLVLEPNRRVAIMAMADGVVRSLGAALGASVRETQEIVQLDRTEAAARLKIAKAEVNEMQAMAGSKPTGPETGVAQARLDAAKARAELAQLELDRCILRASFSGRILAYPVSPGQYVPKGTTLAELADVSSLRVLVPVDRTAVKEGGTVDLLLEGKTVAGKIQTLLPLPDVFAPLRELAMPWAAAWVTIANPDGKAYEPGQRVGDPFLPTTPIAVVPSRAVRRGEEKSSRSHIQVVRSEYVTNVPARVLGTVAAERVQVTGPFRTSDVVIVESSIPLAAGTLIRFGHRGDGPVEGAAPSPDLAGDVADISLPPGTAVPSSGASSRIAPIGSPDANVTKSASRGNSTKTTGKPASRPAGGTSSGSAPF